MKSHRKSWYKRYLNLSAYSSKDVTFAARPDISHRRQTTVLDGPSASAAYGHSFPQPDDLDEGSGDDAHRIEEEPVAKNDSGDDAVEEEVNNLEPQSTTEETRDYTVADSPSNAVQHAKSRRGLDTKRPHDKQSTNSFVTAPTKPRKPFLSRLATADSTKSPPPSSFVTAREIPTSASQPPVDGALDVPANDSLPRSSTGDSAAQANNADSTTQLLPRTNFDAAAKDSSNIQLKDTVPNDIGDQEPSAQSQGMVRFNLPQESLPGNTLARVRSASRRRSWRRNRQGPLRPGEIVKLEKMLVRVDSTMQELPSDYNENDSLKTSSRTVEKWREFVVVLREGITEDADFSIQMYKTRVIPSKEDTKVKKRSTYEIPLIRRTTHVNLYSTLDKTLVIWVPSKLGTMMYVLRTHSVASAVEWYTFIRYTLGSHRSNLLQVNVPDLSVNLQIENPFEALKASISAAQAANNNDTAMNKTFEAERAVANVIINRSLKMLENNPEWADVLEAWLAKGRIGLAWKRYDRLEWVHGANEERMYGTLAMQQTHELELRPKDHYPTSAKSKEAMIDEPAPVEGFLIRLTSQKGHVRRLGKMYFKRLYFTVHNQYLCYCRPAKALPPPPPKDFLKDQASVPSASEIVDSTPLIYAVNPYPTTEGEIDWLHEGTPESRAAHDEEAFKEAERKVNSMLEAEGYINLSHVVRVQNAQRGNSPADANVDQGPDVDFHEDVEDTR